jgi:uncharacterized protein (DUF1015 family)
MAEIFPFPAYRYNLERVKLAEAVTQPYDKITPGMQQRYYQISPYNLISVEKGLATPEDSVNNSVYTRAEDALKSWIANGILVRDARPGIYVYFQEYSVSGGNERRTRKGFIALGRVEDYSAGVVYRHEQTLSGPKVDRLELLRHTRTHTGQLFMLYTDRARHVDAQLDAIAAGSPPAEAQDEYGVIHRLWPVFDPNVIAEITRAMASQKLVIADGHHRYETALAYRDERRAQSGTRDLQAPYEKAMMTFFNTSTEGLLVLPTHRLVSNVPALNLGALRQKTTAAFEQQDYSFGSESARIATYERFRRDLATQGRTGRAVGMYAAGTFTLFRLRPDANLDALMPDVPPAQRQLDVVLLHRALLQDGLDITPTAVTAERNLTYEREMDAAIAAVDEGRAQLCFLLNAVSVDTVTKMALSGEVLPQKSTDFYPKLLSGLTLYCME